MKALWLAGLLMAGACSPMNSADIAALMTGLASDPATACLALTSPYGVNLFFTRSNTANSTATCGGNMIAHGTLPTIPAGSVISTPAATSAAAPAK